LIEDGGQQYKPEYGQKNPMNLVPSLQVGEHILTESVAILEYLEETYTSGVSLLPKDPFLKAKVREIVNIVACDIHPVQNLRVVAKVEKDFGASRVAWGKYWVEHGFQGLEKIIAKSSGKYAVGDSVTMADVLIVPQVFAAVSRYATKAEDFPNLFRVANEAAKLEAFQKAEPKNQPDTPAESK
jgi:maleylacetoacetate isomerase